MLRGADLSFTLRLDGREEDFRGRMNGTQIDFYPPWRSTRATLARLR